MQDDDKLAYWGVSSQLSVANRPLSFAINNWQLATDNLPSCTSTLIRPLRPSCGPYNSRTSRRSRESALLSCTARRM